MSDLSNYSPDAVGRVMDRMEAMGFEVVEMVEDPDVRALADARHRVASDPLDQGAINDALRAHDLVFLLPGHFFTDADSLRLNPAPQGEE